MANYKAISSVFVVLTIIFAGAAVYFAAYHSVTTTTATQVSTTTSVVSLTDLALSLRTLLGLQLP